MLVLTSCALETWLLKNDHHGPTEQKGRLNSDDLNRVVNMLEIKFCFPRNNSCLETNIYYIELICK